MNFGDYAIMRCRNELLNCCAVKSLLLHWAADKFRSRISGVFISSEHALSNTLNTAYSRMFSRNHSQPKAGTVGRSKVVMPIVRNKKTA